MKNSVRHNEWVKMNKERVASYKRKHYALHLKERKVSEKNYRDSHREEIKQRLALYRESNSHKVRARDTAGEHISLEECEVCGTDKKVERHHYDYSLPLSVIFLCATHHRRLHRIIPEDEIHKYNTGPKIKELLSFVPSPYFTATVLA